MWEKITIKKYKEIEALLKNKEIDIETSVSLLAVIEGNTREYYYDIPYADLNKRILSLARLNNVPETKVYKSYSVKGVKYNLIDNISRMKAGQFIDYCNTLKNNPDDFALLLAFVLIPEGKTYGEYNVFETSTILSENMNIVDAIAITGFFFVLLDGLQKAILQYSNRKMKRIWMKRRIMKKLKVFRKIKALKAFLDG